MSPVTVASPVVTTTVPVATATTVPVTSGAKPPLREIIDGVYTVQRGDSLWAISADLCGSPYRWRDIYTANRFRIVSPNFIVRGIRLVIPCAIDK
jgi:nucleoid-associated protein YgaU